MGTQGLLDPMHELRKQQDPWALTSSAAVCPERSRAEGTLRGPQRLRWALDSALGEREGAA